MGINHIQAWVGIQAGTAIKLIVEHLSRNLPSNQKLPTMAAHNVCDNVHYGSKFRENWPIGSGIQGGCMLLAYRGGCVLRACRGDVCYTEVKISKKWENDG